MRQREHLDARGDRSKEAGFTLLELMIVVLIIAILIAVLIPVFMGASARAKDRASQSSLHDALTAAKTVAADKGDYSTANPGTLTAAAGVGSLTFLAGGTPPSGQNDISVDAVANYIVLAGKSKSGECFYVADDTTAGTTYAKAPAAGGCSADGAPLQGDPAWQPKW